MELKKIAIEIDQAKSLIDAAISQNNISAIDRDLVLQKLRNIYDAILLLQVTSSAINNSEASIAQQTVFNSTLAPKVAVEEVVIPIIEPSKVIHIEPEVTVINVEEKQPFEIETIQQLNTATESTITNPTLNNTSLQQTEVAFEQEPTITQNIIIDEAISRANKPTIEIENNTILAEKFTATAPSINEVVNHKTEPTGINDLPIADIESSIGLNEKFLFIRELFSGNAQLYAQTIDKLNFAGSYDSALSLIKANFNWNYNAEITCRLLDLIRRRYL